MIIMLMSRGREGKEDNDEERGNGPNLVSTIGGRKPAGGEKRTSAMLLLVTTFSTWRNLDDEDYGA